MDVIWWTVFCALLDKPYFGTTIILGNLRTKEISASPSCVSAQNNGPPGARLLSFKYVITIIEFDMIIIRPICTGYGALIFNGFNGWLDVFCGYRFKKKF